MNTGVACECGNCTGPQWYDRGACQTCGSDATIQHTWVVDGGGSSPPAAPHDALQFESGLTAQLISIWTNLVLVRGLMPVTANSDGYETPPWFEQRGVRCSVRFSESADDSTALEQFGRAREWTNQAFVLRVVATLEAFLPNRKKIHRFLLPNRPGPVCANGIMHVSCATQSHMVNRWQIPKT
jgi:hypothetical protein